MKRENLFPLLHKAGTYALCVFMFLLPFISRVHSERATALTAEFNNTANGVITDHFLYAKEAAVIVFSAALIFLFAAEMILKNREKHNTIFADRRLRLTLIMCGTYSVMLLISGILADHKELVSMGMPGQYEGLLGTLGYITLFILSIHYFSDKRSLMLLSDTVILLSMAIGICAVMEYMGQPLQETTFFAKLMGISGTLKSTTRDVHITFYNPNYFGTFCALIFPVTLGASLASKDILKKLTGLAAAALVAFGAVTSGSLSGVTALVCGVILMLFIYVICIFRGHIDRKGAVSALCVCAALCITGAVIMTKNDLLSVYIAEYKQSLLSDKTRNERLEALSHDHYVPTEIKSEKGSLFITDIHGNTLRIMPSDGGLLFFDSENAELEPTVMNGYYSFDDERYENCAFEFTDDNDLYCDLGYRSDLVFRFEDGEFKPFVHGLRTLDHINSYRGAEFFADKLTFATGRGFIWGTTLGMLKKCVIIGFGNGNFAAEFPQCDYVSLLEVYGTPEMLVDKPHSFYLGIAADSGLISLAAVLVLLADYLIRCFGQLILHPDKDSLFLIRVGLFASVTAFMIAGIANDSSVTVNPVFWILLGAGISSLMQKKTTEAK